MRRQKSHRSRWAQQSGGVGVQVGYKAACTGSKKSRQVRAAEMMSLCLSYATSDGYTEGNQMSRPLVRLALRSDDSPGLCALWSC